MSDNPPAKARERMPALTRALTDAALLDRARDALERRLAADPRDEGTLLAAQAGRGGMKRQPAQPWLRRRHFLRPARLVAAAGCR